MHECRRYFARWLALVAVCALAFWVFPSLFNASPVAFSATETTVVYLPLISKPWVPMPGYWVSNPPNIHIVGQFHVNENSTYVDQITLMGLAWECGISFKVTYDVPVPIVNNQFSFTGPFYGSGTFSPDAVVATLGLNNYPIGSCILNRAFWSGYRWTSSPIGDSP